MAGISLDWDELRFLVEVLTRLNAEERLPLLALWLVINALRASAETASAATRSLALGADAVLRQADDLLMELLDDAGGILQTQSVPQAVLLELVLSDKPEVSLANLVPGGVYAIFGAAKPTLVKSYEGSWHEVWQYGLAALAATEISLLAINGVTN